jgi:thiol:disulfide interchange protein
MQKFCFYSALFFLFISISSFRQKNAKEKLNWISLEEAELKMKTDPRPILIDLYTDWCGWCKVMDRKTYTSQDGVAGAR